MQSDDLLGAVHDAVYAALIENGVEELAAITATQALCHHLQQDFGGRAYYVPALDKDVRHREIAEELAAGTPPARVAQKHHVHPRTVEKIAAKARHAPNDDPGLGTKDWIID